MIPLLCPAYLPNVRYCAWMLQQSTLQFTGDNNYQKQTYRNRTEIYGANGKLKLTIPIRHTHKGTKPLDKEVEIAYEMDWQKQHWKSICSAYRSAPYFEFYETDIAPYFNKKTASLFLYNYALIKKIMALIQHPFEHQITPWNPKQHSRMDELLSPKNKTEWKGESYTQVFANKYGFISNLSILDVLFNLGPNTLSYLKKI